MTYYERLKKAISGDAETIDDIPQEGTLDSLLMYAYFVGKEDGVRAVSDRATAKWKEQLRKAKACRYWRMAVEIVGEGDPWTHGRGFVYHPDYAGDYGADFGGSIWNEANEPKTEEGKS